MVTTIKLFYDGEVFRPESPLDLEANTSYIVTITPITDTPVTNNEKQIDEDQGNLWDLLERLSGTVEGPVDWSAEHDHYIYGTPKRNETTES